MHKNSALLIPAIVGIVLSIFSFVLVAFSQPVGSSQDKETRNQSVDLELRSGSAIKEVLEERRQKEEVIKILEEAGISNVNCTGYQGIDCDSFFSRILKNRDLFIALKTAKRHGVSVIIANVFEKHINLPGFLPVLWIDANATDESIIEFLVGK